MYYTDEVSPQPRMASTTPIWRPSRSCLETCLAAKTGPCLSASTDILCLCFQPRSHWRGALWIIRAHRFLAYILFIHHVLLTNSSEYWELVRFCRHCDDIRRLVRGRSDRDDFSVSRCASRKLERRLVCLETSRDCWGHCPSTCFDSGPRSDEERLL